MKELERDLLQALLDLEGRVASMKTANPKPDLRPLFDRIDQLTAKLPQGTAPELMHFLHRKSYEKARLFLQGRETENQAGTCRH